MTHANAFPLNAWYAAAWSHEVEHELAARRICDYHGLVFNSAGRCTYMPAQKTINPSACVRSYPVAERHRLVWLWPGDPALADPASIPDFHWNDGTDWVGEGGTIYSLKCDYRL